MHVEQMADECLGRWRDCERERLGIRTACVPEVQFSQIPAVMSYTLLDSLKLGVVQR
jgi:hypothetical protein